MAFNFNDDQEGQNPISGGKGTIENNTGGSYSSGSESYQTFIPQTPEQAADAKIKGLSVEEIQDPNAIIVTVSDLRTPVIVLFGARTSGKTMTLIRLTKYLETMGYNVVPDPIFRPDSDTHYNRMCDGFGSLVHSDYAAVGNDVMSFMLVKVISPNGRTLCQILEAPGEHYFDSDIPDREFPAYIENISRTIKNRKTWMFIVEENWGGKQTVRDLYAKKIQAMQHRIKSTDKIIFTCHKVDKSVHFLPNGYPNTKEIFNTIKDQYPGIFDKYKNTNPITRWFAPYKFSFVTFSAGAFTSTANGRQVYTPGDDYYPRKLWEAIKKNI